MMDSFLNDNYKLLKVLYDNQSVVMGKKVVPLTQLEISAALNFSKMKVSAIFIELQKQGLVIQETRGKYSLSEDAENIIKGIEAINKKLEVKQND